MSHDHADASLDELARRAAEGDREALSALVGDLQHPMYRLALRFLGHPDDAQDACQEILVRIVTRLGTFEGRSKFTTWAYTVAVRSLLRTRKRLIESSVQGAEQFAAFLDARMGDIDPTLEEVEYRLLCEEVRISCTYGMLLCLSRPQRAAYLLADVLGLPDQRGGRDPGLYPGGVPAAGLAGTAHPAAGDRQPLRARRPGQPVPLRPQITSSQAAGILDRDRLPLAGHPREEVRVWIEPMAKQLDAVVAIGDLYRFDRFAAPAQLWEELQSRFPDLLTSA